MGEALAEGGEEGAPGHDGRHVGRVGVAAAPGRQPDLTQSARVSPGERDGQTTGHRGAHGLVGVRGWVQHTWT